MDAGVGGGGGGAGVSAAAASGSYGLVRTVVGYSTSPLFFWLLTVVLVAAIHIASGSTSSRSDEEEREEKKKKMEARRDAFAAAEEREVSGRGDDRVLEMMRSFSFMQATEEDFMEGMASYEYSHVDSGKAPELVAPEPFAPSPASTSLSFKFQHQIPEIPREAALVSRELPAQVQGEQDLQEEKAPSVLLESAGKHEHEPAVKREHEVEAEETELVLEEHVELQRRKVMEQTAPSMVVATTHNYQFLTERDFRGFVREPEAMTVRVQESFMPASPPAPPAQHEERRVVNIVPRSGGFLTERDFQPADEPDVRDRAASPGMRTPSRSREPANSTDVCESVASSGKRTPSRNRKPADEPDVCESVPSSGKRTPSRSRKPANSPDVCETVASSGKRTPPQTRKPASSPSVACKGSAVGASMSFASEFSGFGDSDSESSASDGYSVKDLVVDSDSDWFLSEKDFPASARDSGNLKNYKAKMLKAIEALEAVATLEQSYQDSATTVSPGSVGQGSPDTIPDGSPKFPEDMWSRSPSPDVEYKEDEDKVSREAEAQNDEDVEQRSTAEEEGSVDMCDDEHSPKGKKIEPAPVYDLAPVADKSMDHSEKETITLNDYSGEAFSDTQRSPEAVSAKEVAAVSSDQVAGPANRSHEPSEKEDVGSVDHSLEHSSDERRETSSESGQSYEIVFDDKRRLEPLETGFVGTNDHSHELISDVWKEITSRNDQTSAVAYANEGSLDAAEEEFVGRNDRSNELISYEKKVTSSTTNDQSIAVTSDEKSIPETPEEEFSVIDRRNGAVPGSKNIPETREDEEQATANDYMDDAARQAYVSVTGKAKIYDEEGDDPEVKWKDLTEEEEDELESLWEHQDLIEQLKLELKKVRSIGLPTILEESETPKAPMEDLKPWRIDAKFLREDPMDELNKFYKSYRERMRKFDILCYQKMYAIDFLQLRGPQQSANSLKSLSPTMTSILSHNFRSSRRRSPEDPSERFLKELRYDLEMVYVGQMCLSWEFLRWQYEQARDLPESDPYHSHQYNQVAGEFQQFQVVVQRFVEDESFKGPRLPNYINNRCVLRNLLQVPVIKEDSLKDRMEDQRKGNHVITSEELEEIMEEAMHILWEFIKADKVETTPTSVLKGLSSTHVELQDPSDHDLMAHIHAALQKKEKRLKDLLRTGNCIVKKFKKPKEDRSNQNLFFSQVDMKLVARVLRMPRITSEQLQWCKAKLDKIIPVDRKIHREASFLLFPC
ncbi:hypothetical protein PAHAL_2G263700 [Panicum hallii]|uniref:Uncharacterized protein n=1 Tax=Panicum hallii TaxID=206008 RepID=A0A2S3GZI2_9POAL|nr:uncharacterized protein LOC112880227 isoform X1 [Panicum hallii]PAN12371.1 hypothetical protein PAHAL_2G263700 [Panicum hallii]